MDRPPLPPVDLTALLTAARGPGPVWTLETDDLDVNLVRFEGGAGVPEHVNREVDVFGVVVQGRGVLEVDGVAYPLAPGQAFLVPKGAQRSIRAAGGPFAYVTCHRRRGRLWPS